MRIPIVLLLMAGFWKEGVSQCQPGLAVYNSTNHLLLPIGSCYLTLDTKSLNYEPHVTYIRANASETYLLMLLERIQNNNDMFILHWLVSGIKSQDTSLQTKVARVLAGYTAPVNKTDYEFRLYNMTGKDVWNEVNMPERMFFLPKQWLAKNSIYTEAIAKTQFDVKDYIQKPGGWIVPAHPVGVQPPPPSYPSLQPHQPLSPQYPPLQPPQQPVPPQYPPQQPPHQPVPPQYPPQQPVPPQYPPQYPPQQPLPPQYPPQQPPLPTHPIQYPPTNPQHHPAPPLNQYPTQVLPQLHPSLPQYPTEPSLLYPMQHPSNTVNLQIKSFININGTIFRILRNEDRKHTILKINSTFYSSDSNIKNFKLTPYLIIDNISYIWRNITHNPGKGLNIYLNDTLYVPYNGPNKEIHHHYYHKGSASNLSPPILVLTPIIAVVLYVFHS